MERYLSIIVSHRRWFLSDPEKQHRQSAGVAALTLKHHFSIQDRRIDCHLLDCFRIKFERILA